MNYFLFNYNRNNPWNYAFYIHAQKVGVKLLKQMTNQRVVFC